jgi:Xaa-Pro aminopeptidase
MIRPAEHARRRRALMRLMSTDAIALIPAATPKVRNSDVHFPFRQDSDFWYLSGFPEPDALLVLVPGRKAAEAILFCKEAEHDRQIYDGMNIGPERAVDQFALDDAFPIDDIDDILPGLMEGKARVYYPVGRDEAFDLKVMNWLNRARFQGRSGGRGVPTEFVALGHHLAELRLLKSPAELKLMRDAAALTARAHSAAMAATRPGKTEAAIHAELLKVFTEAGAEASYEPIVASGRNACLLHYRGKRDLLKDGEVLLIDAGAEVEGYAADVTRSFPINGRFSPAQRALYDIVLNAQLAAIEKARPRQSWIAPHDAAVAAVTEGLIDIGLIKGPLNKALAEQRYQRFFMHKTGHWLGLDVHDVGDYKIHEHWRELEPGMTLTIEPGIYVPWGAADVPKAFWGCGIRIEDDVLVTSASAEVLTHALPKDPMLIEAMVGIG